MRLAILGGGTIARLVLVHLQRGDLPGVEVVGVCGRNVDSRGAALAAEFGVPYIFNVDRLLDRAAPQVVLEAASHAAVRAHLVAMLAAGVSVIVLSAGALADDRLRAEAEAAASASGALLYVPSGGIGGLDALKGACAAGVDAVRIEVSKPPAAWSNIPYVEALRLDLDRISVAVTLYEGPARDGVLHFPQNVNIAAVLSLAGIGFDRTRLKVVADPGLTRNTHTIEVTGKSGRFTVVLENIPAPGNPKTAWLACYSALAAVKALGARVRYGS